MASAAWGLSIRKEKTPICARERLQQQQSIRPAPSSESAHVVACLAVRLGVRVRVRVRARVRVRVRGAGWVHRPTAPAA